MMDIFAHYRIICILAMVILNVSTQAPISMAGVLDFSTAWQYVTERSNVLVAEKANIDHAEYTRQANRDLYLPQINLNAAYIYLDDKVQLSPQAILDSMPAGDLIGAQLGSLVQSIGLSAGAIEHGLTSTLSDRDITKASLNVLWPLFTGGRISAAQNIAEASLAETKQQHALKLYEQFETLCARYFAVVMVQQLLDTRTEVVESLKIHLQHAQLLVDNGQIAEVERLQAEAAYDKAQVEQEKSANDLLISQAGLTSLLQEKSPVFPSSPLFINLHLPPLDSFIQKTLAGYPGLAILDAKEEMATGVVNVEEGKYYPEVALLGNYSLYEEDNLASELEPDWFVGMAVSVPLLDRSGRGGKRQAAKSLVAKVKALRKQARQDLSLLVERTYRQATQAIAEHKGLASSLKLAEKTLVLRKKAFDQGLATSLDVIDARLYVAAVKTQRSHAAYTYVTKLAGILAISGELDTFAAYQDTAQ
jgi:outer membrane protein TolC